jgi:3-hydroxybutyryl-CoA dehydrogenase
MAKKVSQKKYTKKLPEGSARAVVYIVGESPLVEEFASLCSSKGYDVCLQWNSNASPKEREKSFRQTSVIPPNTSVALELTNTDIDAKTKNIQKLDKALGPQSAILTTSITTSATQQATLVRHKHRLVGFGALPSFSSRPVVEVAPTIHTPKETIEVVRRFFRTIDKEIEIVQDRVGMVLPRILCQIINEATFALMEDVASPKDIDTAMRLGLNYPHGPIEWADKIGIRQIYAVLSAMESDLKEDRYRVSPLLKQMALSGDWWSNKEGVQ